MAIPGLALQDPATFDLGPSAPQIRTQRLHPETEYRFESSFSSPLTIRLVSGTAELFGTELAPAVAYNFRGHKCAIFTWQGCDLEITGVPEAEYVAEETPMMQVANLHFALEDLRTDAGDRGQHGPRVMIVGPDNAGKTSLAKTLTAYTIKNGRQPTVVNLDPRQGLLSMPGSLTATTMATLMDLEEGWGSSPVSGPTAVPVKMPLCYHFASQDPEQNAKLFKPLVARLGLALSTRFEGDMEARSSGCVIDTPGSLASGKPEGYEMIQHIASELSVNVIVVLGSERLFSEMKKRFQGSVTVLRLDKSGGCVDRTEPYMKQFRQSQIREYFYGYFGMPLSPFTQFVQFDQLAIYRINDGTTSSSAFDPGADDDDDEADYQPTLISNASHDRITPSLMLQNTILAVTHADAHENLDRIRDASVAWYVYIADVDESKRLLKLVSPISGRVPSNALVWGSWPEGVADLVS